MSSSDSSFSDSQDLSVILNRDYDDTEDVLEININDEEVISSIYLFLIFLINQTIYSFRFMNY